MGRVALSAVVLCVAACGSSGGSGASGVGNAGVSADAGVDGGTPTGGGGGGGPDAGPPDAGPPDAGPPDAGPPGGGDWRQYRYDARGGSVNPGVFAASEVANLTEFWK